MVFLNKKFINILNIISILYVYNVKKFTFLKMKYYIYFILLKIHCSIIMKKE